MSWHYLQEEVAVFSLQNYLDSIPSAQLKLDRMQETASFKGREMELSTRSRYGMTCQHSMDYHGLGKLTSSLEDFHARTSAHQERELELKVFAAAFGKSIQESLERLGLGLSSRKTLHCFELEESEQYSETFPRWGILLDGVCLELGTSAKFTKETECGYLPTPTGVNGGVNHIAGRLDEWGGSSNPFRKTEIGRVHCPRFEEWMMGWPETWAARTGFEMDKYQSWLQQHSEFFHVD